MAIVKTDGSILAISGRFGGIYFKTTGGMIQAQAMPRVVNMTKSGQRKENIDSFSSGFSLLAALLVLGFMILWEYFSREHKDVDKNGKVRKRSAREWWIHICVPRMIDNNLPFWVPPRSPTDYPEFTGRSPYWHGPTAPFYKEGVHNGRDYYVTNMERYHWNEEPTVKKFYLWHSDGQWYVTPSLGMLPPVHFWFRPGDEPNGIFEPFTESDGPLEITP